MQSESKYIFTTLKEPYLAKPDKSLVGEIVSRLNNSLAEKITLSDLKHYVESGFPFAPSAWEDSKRNTQNIKFLSAIILDFDNKDQDNIVTQDYAISLLAKQDIAPNFTYSTLSHTPECPRFRLGFLLERPIRTDSKESVANINKYFFKGFQHFFSHNGKIFVDQSINAISFFYAGTDFKIINEAPMSYESVYCFLDSYKRIYSKNNSSTQCPFNEAKSGEKGCESIFNIDNKTQCPVELTGGESLNEIRITNHIKNLELSINPDRLLELKYSHSVDSKEPSAAWGFILLAEMIQCLSDFAFGTRKIKHDELVKLATNLIPIRGGHKFMCKIMDAYNQKNPSDPYDPKKLDVLKWVKKQRPYPYKLSSFSPYKEDWEYGDIIKAVQNPRKKIFDHKRDNEGITMEEARILLDKDYRLAEESDNKIIIIQAPTGLGKTECLKHHFPDAFISTKTNKLKQETAKRLGITHFTPDYPMFEDKITRNQVKTLDSLGLYQNSSKLIYDIADGKIVRSVHDTKLAQDYVERNDRCYSGSADRIVSTHSRGVRDIGRFPHPIIVFDEDPIQSILSMKRARYSDLLILGEHDPQFKDVYQYFADAEENRLYEFTISIKKDDKDLRELILDCQKSLTKDSYIYHLLSARSFIKEKDGWIIFVGRNSLPVDKKCIIMSATPNREVYWRLYGEDLKEYRVENVIAKGKIIQDNSISYSKSSLTKLYNSELVKKKIAEINANTDIEAVITFKNFRENFPDKDTNVYFFNSEGTDNLKGKNIAVFGTPILPEQTIFLYASICGIDMSKEGIRQMSYRRVEFNGFTFRFHTYRDKDLAEIHMSLIEQELTQAVGRNRYLTEDCTVYLYSAFPIRYAA